MPEKLLDFPLRRKELQMLIDALEVLSPDSDKGESLRLHLLDRLYTRRAANAQTR